MVHLYRAVSPPGQERSTKYSNQSGKQYQSQGGLTSDANAEKQGAAVNTKSLYPEETRKAGAAVVSEPRHLDPNGSTPPRPAWDDSPSYHFWQSNPSRELTRHSLQIHSSSPRLSSVHSSSIIIAVTKVLLLSLLPFHTFVTSVFFLDKHRVTMGWLGPKMGRPQEIMKQHFLY